MNLIMIEKRPPQEDILAAAYAAQQHPQHQAAQRYQSPSDGVSGEPLVLPPPPQPPAAAESHCILIQRMPQRHRKTRGERRADWLQGDEVKREQYKAKACQRERIRLKSFNHTFQG